MSVGTLPVDLPLVIHAGTVLHRVYAWKPDGQTGQDFTGWSGLFLIGPRCGTAITEASTAGTGLTLDDEGFITLLLDIATTNALPEGTDLVYQLDLTDPAGTPLRLLTGRVDVICGLARAA